VSSPGDPLEPDIEAVRADVLALAAMERGSARPGELRSAAWIAERLRELGAAGVSIEAFRYQRSYALAHAVHSLAGIAAIGRGAFTGALGGLAVLASYEAEVSGRRQWLRRVLPAGRGANVLARIPASRRARGTLVLVAHHDAANTGLVWHPAVTSLGAARRLRRRRVDPFMAPVAAALVLGIAGNALGRRNSAGRPLRAIGAALLAASVAANADVARGATVPGASDNASGVAVVLELVRRRVERPLAEVDVIALLCGAEEAGMGGMADFMHRHAAELRPSSTLVLGLDTLGAGTPIVAGDEGAAIAGEPAPQRWRIGGWTDPILAIFAGIPAASILSMGPGYFPNYHRPSDTPQNVDWDSVRSCARIAAGTVAALERRMGSGR
jgi:hypothetical protein